LSHNGVRSGDVRAFFQQALSVTEAYHLERLVRVSNGDDLNDLRCVSDEQTKTNVEAFIELLEEQKG
jgi:hypothetical protein